MNKTITILLFTVFSALIWSNAGESKAATKAEVFSDSNPLKTQAFNILENKCNVCHRKQNPFMIFSEKNMDKRAKKINKMVFVYKRMPKGDYIKLTTEEQTVLKDWISSLGIE